MVLTGCSKQAIVLKGPGAVLKAKSVVFRDNGPGPENTPRAQPLGLVIAATNAVVELTDVSFTGNNAVRFSRSANVPLARPYLHPPCKDDSVTGGVTGWGADSDGSDTDEDAVLQKVTGQQACGSPLLASSLVDLEQSTAVLRSCRLQDNTADALLTARGDASDSLQLLAGTRLESNTARWLVVADSWMHDRVGRQNMKAPQPSEAVKELDMDPPYTSYALMGSIRSPTMWDEEAAGGSLDEKGRKLQQQPKPGRQQQQQGPPQSPSPGARQQQQGRPDPAQGPQLQQQQQQLPTGMQAEAAQQQQLQQPGTPQEPEQLSVTPDAVVGQAPKGQVGVRLALSTQGFCFAMPCRGVSADRTKCELLCACAAIEPAAVCRAVLCYVRAGAAASQAAGGVDEPECRAVRPAVAAARQHKHAGHRHDAQHWDGRQGRSRASDAGRAGSPAQESRGSCAGGSRAAHVCKPERP